MKAPGRLITYVDKDRNTIYGRTYNKENLVNGKMVVHLLDGNLEPVKNEKGEDKKVLVAAGKLVIRGFID